MNVVEAAVGPYERVVWATDAATGLKAVVAVHSTALGPALGGTRFFPYPDEASAMIDVLRLAEGMTLKAAAAGLHLGGGKAVIIADPATAKTPALFAAYAEVVDSLGGAYYTAEDVGTTVADMDLVRRGTPYVVGVSPDLGGSGDPSPYTSRGVVAAMRAAWAAETGAPSLTGTRVAVQGAGKVGRGVARLVAAEGAEVLVTDVRPASLGTVCAQTGAEAVAPDRLLGAECDILCPCALGGVLSEKTVGRLHCRLVCGSANNQLATDDVADSLSARGIVYVPDFIANAGGLIAVADEIHGFDADRVTEAVDAIGDVVHDLLEEAREEGLTTLAAARRRAVRRLEGARRTAARERARAA
jgi:valine dehydrogenase (NAD+)